ncbi:hypothetical protein GCM10025779_17990 [Arthrobacter cryoconiti]|nr:hypothetical protein [Arthrobacter cryoconiti]
MHWTPDGLISELGHYCLFARRANVALQAFTGPGIPCLRCEIATLACEHSSRAHDVLVPDLEEAWIAAQECPFGYRRSPSECTGVMLRLTH